MAATQNVLGANNLVLRPPLQCRLSSSHSHSNNNHSSRWVHQTTPAWANTLAWALARIKSMVEAHHKLSTEGICKVHKIPTKVPMDSRSSKFLARCMRHMDIWADRSR